jgi:hypothetical protein
MARVAVGNAPASPMPNKNRIIKKEPTPTALAVKAVMMDPKATMAPNTYLGPSLSPIQPPGTWKRA